MKRGERRPLMQTRLILMVKTDASARTDLCQNLKIFGEKTLEPQMIGDKVEKSEIDTLTGMFVGQSFLDKKK